MTAQSDKWEPKVYTPSPQALRLKLLVYGPPGCLAADTWLKYAIFSVDGERQNRKGGTIETLYKRFHKLPRKGAGFYQRPETLDFTFWIQSVSEGGRVHLNRIVDVVYSGPKKVYRLTTTGGRTLRATADHKISDFTTGVFRSLCTFAPGDFISVNPGVPRAKEHKALRPIRAEYMVKYHPVAPQKIVDGKYKYYRLKRSKAVLEASVNGLELERYIELLNTELPQVIDALWHVPQGYSIHHLNEEPCDDRPGNLIMVVEGEHQRLYHAEKNNLSIAVYVEPDQIASLEANVEMVETYDLVCSEPDRNFIAEGIEVHNSGKSTLAASASVVEAMSPVLYINAESGIMSVSEDWPGRIDTQKLSVVDFAGMAELGNLFDYLAFEKHPYCTVVLDSLTELQAFVVSAWKNKLIPKDQQGFALSEEQDKRMGLKVYERSTDQLRGVCRKFRDLPLHVIMVAHNDNSDQNGLSVTHPALTPKFRDSLVGYMDIVGFLTTREEAKESEKEVVRLMTCTPKPTRIAKDRSPGGKLGGVLTDPTMQEIWARLTAK